MTDFVYDTEDYGNMVEVALDDNAELIERFRQARASRQRWEADEKELGEQIKKLLDSANVGTVDGRPVIRLSVVEKFLFDREQFERYQPGMYLKFRTKPSVSRTLKLLA